MVWSPLQGDVSKNDEFCIKNDEFCIENEELCIKNEEVCIKNAEFCSPTETQSCAQREAQATVVANLVVLDLAAGREVIVTVRVDMLSALYRHAGD